MATYVNDLRLKEIGTGESSGTWGSETNTNLELIGEALGFGTEGITTNADTHTTTVADGSTDPGRAMYLKYTGTLDSACTITIAPNTMSRMQFIENGTSGSQNIIISQGTGANVTIPAGDVKAVYLDGAGSGAAVVDAFASLSTVDLKVQDDLTVTDDASVGGNLTLTGNGDFNGDLDVDGTTNLDVVDIDGAVDMATTLTLGGNADFNGDLDVDGTTNLDVVDIDGAVDMASTLAVTGIVTLTDDLIIGDGKTIGSASDVDAMTIASNGQVTFTQTLIGTDLDISGDVDVDGTLETDNLTVGGAQGSDGQVLTSTGSGVAWEDASTFNPDQAQTFNESGNAVDFRIESDSDANMFFLDGSANAIGIGTASPSNLLHISSSTADSVEMKITNTNADSIGANIHLEKDSASPADNDFCGEITWVGSNDNNQQPSFGSISVQMTDVSDGTEDGDMIFKTIGAGTFAERMRITSTGNLGIGESAPHEKVHVTGASGVALLMHMDADTADGTSSLLFKNDSTNTDVRIKAGIIYQRDDPGTRGTGDLHLCVNGVNSDTNVSVSDSKLGVLTDGSVIVSSDRMLIDASANVLFGMTNSGAGGAGGMSRGGLCITESGTSNKSEIKIGTGTADHSGTLIYFYRRHDGDANDVTALGSISHGSTSTAYNTSSDYRLKENVDYTFDATSRLKQLKPARFNFKEDSSITLDGFLAHEVSSIVPEAINGTKDQTETKTKLVYDSNNSLLAEDIEESEWTTGKSDGTYPSNSTWVASKEFPVYQGIDQAKLVPLLVKTIQELEARITTLEG